MKKLMALFVMAATLSASQFVKADNRDSCGFNPGGCRCRLQVTTGNKSLYDILFGEVLLKEQKTFTYSDAISALRACKEEVLRMDVCR